MWVHRLKEGAANANANWKLFGLKLLFALGMGATPPRARHMPGVPVLPEDNTRKGLFEYETLHDALPDYLTDLSRIFHAG